MKRKMKNYLIVVSIVLFGALLRIVNINQSLWLDEATSIKAATQFSFSEIISEFSPGDFHPPFYYLALKVWVSLFGSSEVAVRSLSVLFGLATIPLVFSIGKKLFDNKVGLMAALLLATSGLHIYYSQEARMYVPATFFATVLVWLFIKVLQEKEKSLIYSDGTNFVYWMGLLIISVLLLYIDYVPFSLLIALAFYLLFFKREHLLANARRWATLAALVFVLFLPWLPTLFEQLKLGVDVKTSVPGWWQVLGGTNIKQLTLVPVKFIIGRISIDNTSQYVLALIVPFLLFGLAFFNAVRAVRVFKGVEVVWVWFVVPVILTAIAGLWLSIFVYFRLLFVLPAFYLLVASGVFYLRGRKKRGVVMASLLVINLVSSGIYLFNPRFHREDWRGAVSWIEQNSQRWSAAAIFVTNNQRDPYIYYSKFIPSYGPDGLLKAEYEKIWLMRYVQPIFDPEDEVRFKVESMGYKKVIERDFNGVVVWQYILH